MASSRKLHLYLRGAELRYSVAEYGRMDAYCIVQLGQQNVRTSPHNNAGRIPFWGFSTTFDFNDEAAMLFTVMDDEITGKDKCVGVGALNLREKLRTLSFFEGPVLLMNGAETRGTIQCSVTLQEENEVPRPPPVVSQTGVLVEVLRGRDLYDAVVFSIMNPLVKLQLTGSSVSVQTAAHHGGGENPMWGDTFRLAYDGETELEVEVHSAEEDATGGVVFIGRGSVDLVGILHGGGGGAFEGPVELKRQANKAGSVFIRVSFTGQTP